MAKRKVKKFHNIFCTGCKQRMEVDITVKANSVWQLYNEKNA